MRLLPLFFLLISLNASATTWVVAPNGNDRNPGTLARPLRTLSAAIDKLKTSDDVQLRGGTYRESVAIWGVSGSADNPIVISPYAKERVVIDGAGLRPKNALVAIGGGSHFVNVQNLEIRNSAAAGVLLWNVRDVKVRWNRIHHCAAGGITSGGARPGANARLTIEGNIVYDTVLQNRGGRAGAWSQAIGIMHANDVVIRRNWVYENHGEGIDFIGGDRGLIAENAVWDNYSVNIYLDNAQDSVVDRNRVFSRGNRAFYRDGVAAAGIAVSNERYAIANPLRHLTITNNLVVRTGTGFQYGDWGGGGGLRQTLIANNTFFQTQRALLLIENGAHAATTVVNNIFYAAAGRTLARAPSRGITAHHNAWYGGDAATRIRGTGDVTADPRLVRAGGAEPADYRPRADSPCRRAGATLPTVRTDYFGVARASPYSIGCIQ